MSFKSKKLSTNHLGFLKGATLFFLGTSIVLFMANAFDIVPTMPNALQYISQIIFTQDGTNTSATGIILEGNAGNAWFKGDVSIASLPNKVCLGTDNNGKIIEGICAGGSNSKVGTGIAGQRCIFTGNQVVCDQPAPLTGYTETDPIFSGGDEGKRCTLENGKIECTQNQPSFSYTETDPIFSTGENSKRCTLENGKIECNQPAPTGTASEPAGNVTNIQFKATGDIWSGTNDLVWKENKLGIGTDNPTEPFQIGDYARMGQNTTIKTGGSFLRMYGYDDGLPSFGGEIKESSPNIQLNLTQQYMTQPYTYSSFQRQIKNAASFLQFNFGTGGNYTSKFTIGRDGSINIGTGGNVACATGTEGARSDVFCPGVNIVQKDMYLEGGDIVATGSKIVLGFNIDDFSDDPTNSMYISNKLVVGYQYLSTYDKNQTNLKFIVNGGMKLGQIGTGDVCNQDAFGTIGIKSFEIPPTIPGGDDGYTGYGLFICLEINNVYSWKQLND